MNFYYFLECLPRICYVGLTNLVVGFHAKGVLRFKYEGQKYCATTLILSVEYFTALRVPKVTRS